jgi:putative ABC transport system ATP-binding protein
MMTTPFISLVDVHKTYRLGKTLVHALRGASLDLHQGEFTALVGPSGSGKSTMLNMAGCIDEPDRGSVMLEGRDVSHLSDDERSRLRNQKIGFIFQSFNLVPVLTVYENVELPLLVTPGIAASERHDRIVQAIEDVELQEFARQLPDKLSGGQRQRVAIARALVTSPLLVLADEPTANLDSGTTQRIVDLCLALNETRGVTFFFSTHDEKLISRVARIVHISDGTILNGHAQATAVGGQS